MIWILLGVLVVLVVGVLILKQLVEGQTDEEKPWPYRAKRYFFSRSEQEFLRLLNESIDRSRYVIFPKVRLADFIEVTVRGREYQSWWNRIKSKHVDYLLWDVRENRIALAIELDGKSHRSEKMQDRDDFVNKLYERVGIKLERVAVGTDFAQEIGRIKSKLDIELPQIPVTQTS